ncbi:MAG: glucose-1-phosphate cytidylyltransferase [Terriglobales bacterium]
MPGVQLRETSTSACQENFVKVVMLCGGLGTRLREETEYRPKPMVEIGGRPILWHIMKLYAHNGFTDFVFCLGYRGNMIKEYFLNYEAMNNDFSLCLGRNSKIEYKNVHREQDFQVTLVDTGPTTMTGGRVKKIEKYIGQDEDLFMLTYGDGVSDVDIRKLVEFHRSHGKLATVTTITPSSRFGVIESESTGRVTSFKEKAKIAGRASAGFFVLNRRVFNYLGGDECIFEKEPLERLAAEGQLMAYQHDGFFYAMDTYREYEYLNQLWSAKQAPWKVWQE